MKRFRELTCAAALAALSLAGTASADAVTDWNEIAANSVAAGRPGPIGLMDLAVVHVAMHDAIQSYERRFERYYVDVKGAKGSKSAAAAAAAHGVLQAYYSATQGAALTDTYTTWLANNGLTGNAGIAVGEAVAAKAATLTTQRPGSATASVHRGNGDRPMAPDGIFQWAPWLAARTAPVLCANGLPADGDLRALCAHGPSPLPRAAAAGNQQRGIRA